MIVGELLRATVNYIIPNASAVQNVFYWRLDIANIPDADVLTFFDDWFTNDWGSRWADVASQNAVLSTVDLMVVNGDGTVLRSVGTAIIGLTGTVVSETTSAAVSAYLSADTALPKTRGRKYVPGVSESGVLNGLFDVATVANLILLLTEYLADFNPQGNAIFKPGVLRTAINLFQAFTGSGEVVDVPAYQRRRKPGVGA